MKWNNGDVVHGFNIMKVDHVEEVNSDVYMMEHIKSGAKLMYLDSADDNKVFYICFRTTPDNSKGTPHIMEHSTLCGSRKFPLKEPFVELAKGSLNTFLNAMTWPDKTMYPVASRNSTDFHNLMDVYLDAVFYPDCLQNPQILMQEGWHYELDKKDGELTYNGVVYNEMKGALSSPDALLNNAAMEKLFPDTTYNVESGGDPDVIPTLSFREFTDFHRRFYHPSNSYIYLYGDMDMEEKLNWLDEKYLSDFDEIEVDSEIKYQKPFSQMQEIVQEYSIASDESEADNTYLSYNKVIGTSLDEKLYLAFQILDYALLSAPGAPLKKALLDAGIGKDIMGSYDNGVYQPIFSVISKNANMEQKEAFVEVIENTLRNIAEGGIDKKALQAGLNYYEFRFREADFGSYPRGLMYGLQLFDSWLYDENQPFIHIEALETFEFLKNKVGTGYYEELIQKYLLDNTHGAIVVVRPEQGRTARLDAQLQDKLQKYKESLSEAEVEKLVADTKALEEYQSEPESIENLEKIPVLRREDISREIAPFFNEEMKLADVPVVYHEIETNGIGYVNVMFDLFGVSAEELADVGILQSVLGIIDTENYEYSELFNEINVNTGGIGTSLELYNNVTRVKEKEFKATFEIKGKALYSQLEKTFAMMAEILTASKLDDTKRIREILAMLKSRLLMKFQSSGHTTAALRALSYASPSAKFKDMTSGIDFYKRVAYIEEHFDEEKEALSQRLYALTKKIFRPDNMMISYTAAREGLEGMEPRIAELAGKLNHEKVTETPCIIHCEKKNEGFKTASKVQYVARTGNFIDRGVEYTGALQILKVILSYDYLWQNIRVKGGAYGCMSSFNRIGEGYFVSYRDPNLKRTIDVYEGVVDYLENFTVSDRDMTKYIIGTISNIDQPMTPATKGERSMNLYMNKVSAEMIKKERAQILDAAQEDIRALAKVAKAVLAADQLCVIGGEEKIEEDKELFGDVTSF